MANKATKTFLIIGGQVSPSAVVLAYNGDHAKRKYNEWLSREYSGKEDHGVGLVEITAKDLVLLRGAPITYSKE